MVDAARLRHGKSWRDLADDISRALEQKPGSARRRGKRKAPAGRAIPFGTLYQWVHSAKGYPSPSFYHQETNDALARALQLDPGALAEAFRESRNLAAPRPAAGKPSSGSQADPLADLIEIIEARKSAYVRKDWLLRLLRRFHRPGEPAIPAQSWD